MRLYFPETSYILYTVFRSNNILMSHVITASLKYMYVLLDCVNLVTSFISFHRKTLFLRKGSQVIRYSKWNGWETWINRPCVYSWTLLCRTDRIGFLLHLSLFYQLFTMTSLKHPATLNCFLLPLGKTIKLYYYGLKKHWSTSVRKYNPGTWTDDYEKAEKCVVL